METVTPLSRDYTAHTQWQADRDRAHRAAEDYAAGITNTPPPKTPTPTDE